MNKISLCIAVLLLVGIASAGKKGQHHEQYKKCLDENKVTFEEFKTLMKAKERPEKFYCVHQCMMKAHGVLNDKGELLFDKIKQSPHQKRLSEDKQKKVMACLEKVGKIANCQDSKKVFECYAAVMTKPEEEAEAEEES